MKLAWDIPAICSFEHGIKFGFRNMWGYLNEKLSAA
jgi:hypothetical protein